MSGPTKIEWADSSWNPVTGCSKVSAGWAYCYAERQAKRFAGRAGYPAEDPFAVTLHPETLDEPLRWRRPRRILVSSMSDLFHERVPDSFIERVFAICAEATWHRFLLLTKRPERMAAFLSSQHIYGAWPLPNVWLGTSIEDQPTADERIPHLLRCRAARWFVSYEPALGPVDFTRIDYTKHLVEFLTEFVRDQGRDAEKEIVGYGPGTAWINALSGEWCDGEDYGKEKERLDWVIAGGESGPKARPAHPDWFRSVRDQCQAAGVPFFFQQWGEWAEDGFHFAHRPHLATGEIRASNQPRVGELGTPGCPKNAWMVRLGKKAAGQLLDGVEHNAYPGEAIP